MDFQISTMNAFNCLEVDGVVDSGDKGKLVRQL